MIDRFVFDVRVGDATIAVELQGSGGQVGAGELWWVRTKTSDDPGVRRLCDRHLERARHELRATGCVRAWIDRDGTKQLVRVEATSIDACRALDLP